MGGVEPHGKIRGRRGGMGGVDEVCGSGKATIEGCSELSRGLYTGKELASPDLFRLSLDASRRRRLRAEAGAQRSGDKAGRAEEAHLVEDVVECTEERLGLIKG